MFDLTQTGMDRYDLLEDFFDISNTNAAQAMGHMNVYPVGQTFVDPGPLVIYWAAGAVATIVAVPVGWNAGSAAGMGGWEGWIPFWGPGRNLGANLQAGNHGAAAENLGELALDVFAPGVGKGAVKGGQVAWGFRHQGVLAFAAFLRLLQPNQQVQPPQPGAGQNVAGQVVRPGRQIPPPAGPGR